MEAERSRYLRARRAARAPLVAALVAVGLSAAPRAGADVIVRSGGQRLEGVKVTAARWDQVLYEQGRNTLRLPGSEIAALERDSVSLEHIRGRMNAGAYAQALREAEKAEGGVQGWELAELLYLKGKALLALGDAKRADEAFQAYLAQNEASKDFWVPHAVYGRGRASIALEKGSDAVEFFRKLDSFGESWKLRSKLGEAQALALEKKYLEARQLFSEVAQAAQRARRPDLEQEAVLGRIKVLVRQEQYAPAVDELQKTFFGTAPSEGPAYGSVRAEATLLMGVGYKNQPGKENLERAEIWLLRAAVVHAHHKEVFRDACSQLVEVYTALGRSDRAAEWKRRLEEGG